MGFPTSSTPSGGPAPSAARSSARNAEQPSSPPPATPRPTPRPPSDTPAPAPAATTAAETQPRHHHRTGLIFHAGTAARPFPGAADAPTRAGQEDLPAGPITQRPASEHPQAHDRQQPSCDDEEESHDRQHSPADTAHPVTPARRTPSAGCGRGPRGCAVLLTGATGAARDAPTASTVRLSPSLVSGLDTATDDMCVLRDACA